MKQDDYIVMKRSSRERLINELKQVKKEKDHYKKLYSEVKKQKDDAIEYVNSIVFEEIFTFVRERAEVKYNLLRMLGEIDE